MPISTASFAIVTAPSLASVTSPEIATAVGTVEPLPTITCPSGTAASLLCAIAALAFTSSLTTAPSAIFAEVTLLSAILAVVTWLSPICAVSIDPST